ncbi:hypothetical protein V6Z11_D02G150600 [Gossypium hirsutum]
MTQYKRPKCLALTAHIRKTLALCPSATRQQGSLACLRERRSNCSRRNNYPRSALRAHHTHVPVTNRPRTDNSRKYKEKMKRGENKAAFLSLFMRPACFIPMGYLRF